MGEAHPSRRAVLTTGGALALAGCLPGSGGPQPQPDPDLRLRLRVATEITELGAAYAAAMAAHPDLASRLAPLAVEHRAHVAALRGPAGSAAPDSPASRSGPATPPPEVPATPAATLAWLTGLEHRATQRRRRQALLAGPGLARLLASVGSCEAAHAALLERGSR